MSKTDLIRKDNNIYAQYAEAYIRKGLSAIPDKYASKMPAIKGWSRYCFELPTLEEAKSWSGNFKETNIAVALGSASGIIGLDVDTTDQEILDLLIQELPPSPVEKKGAKGFTRFYKYNRESSQNFSLNKEVIFEVLSDKKKTTIPPSRHSKTGEDYIWTNLSLLDVNKSDLPFLPPYILDRIMSKIRDMRPEAVRDNFNSMTVSGRNDALAKLCFSLIGKGTELSDAVNQLVKFDKENHEIPYFTDLDEHNINNADAFTNALQLYSYQLQRLNNEHHKKSEEYETPVINSAINEEYKEMVRLGKSCQSQGKDEKLKRELPRAQGVLKTIQENILANSWNKQPEFAFSASLTLMSTLISRKVIFGNLSPNLYVVNVGASGSGKQAPQDVVMKCLNDIGANGLLGSSGAASDSGLVDTLEHSPVRLDVIDEVSGFFKKVTKGKNDYNSQMDDILCRLYTSSNSHFLGRALSEGIKGSCYRPNVNILGATTPSGLSESLDRKSLDKGLLGRFLIFYGDHTTESERLRYFPQLGNETLNILRYWFNYDPPEHDHLTLGGIPQLVLEIKAEDDAQNRLDIIFKEFDKKRRSSEENNPLLPIISRLYQQMVKITTIHAVSRCGISEPIITMDDIKFGYDTILYYYDTIKRLSNDLIFENRIEKDYSELLKHIPKIGTDGVTKQALSKKTRSLGKRKRDEMIGELEEAGDIASDIKTINKKRSLVYWRIK